jgi:RNA polymerase sigma factor (sigma-70 family)
MMSGKPMPSANLNDAELVAECIRGHRDAFERIVERYQSLVCSLAYSATGSLSHSEDLAQEVFVTAWKLLPELREPAKLRPWLCGITRNLIGKALRREGREPLAGADPLEAAKGAAASEPLPPEHAISAEEQAILWRSVEHIPEMYREPVILFYREHQSVEAVAEKLELSSDLVKQRLSRGRKLLHRQVLAFVEGALERTNPGKAFTIGVVAALPALAISTKAAAAGVTAAKESAAAKATTSTGIASAIVGPFLMLFGNYLGYRMSLDSAPSDRERRFIKRLHGGLLVGIFGAGIVPALAMWFGWQFTRTRPAMFMALFTGVSGVYALLTLAASLWILRKRPQDYTASTPPLWEYRSRAVWLGLPLIHIRVGGSLAGLRKPVKAWIAVGQYALGGLFASGRLAIAPLSMGFVAIGLVPFGLLAAGVCTIGGVSLGMWAFGGLAAGWQAYGGGSIAWDAAWGGVALARNVAIGRFAFAAQANNHAAWDLVTTMAWFRYSRILLHQIVWMQLLWIVPMFFWWRMLLRSRKESPAT